MIVLNISHTGLNYTQENMKYAIISEEREIIKAFDDKQQQQKCENTFPQADVFLRIYCILCDKNCE
jgi:hypothetical protein